MVLLEQCGAVLLRQHGMVLLEQCGVVLHEHHGAAASGRDSSSCPAASQALHSKPYLAFLALLGNPPLIGEVSQRCVCLKGSQGALVKLHIPN